MPSPAPPQVRSVDVLAAQAQPADQRRIAASGAASDAGESAVHLIKIYLAEALPVTAEAFALYVGDEWVRKYFEFPGGIYFNSPDPGFLSRHQGDPIRFTLDHDTFTETGIKLPQTDPAEIRRRSMAAPLRRGAVDEATPRLPTKQEALRE